MIGSIPSLRRHVKNVACNYSDAQVKVREATSNDPWGPSSSLMSEIADMTYSALAFSEIMQMIWKRLNDHGKNWRHVYKSLVLLDYLIKLGSEKVAQQCRENIYAIQTLKDFQYVEDNKDQGINVREKAKQLVSLLKDEERLKNERSRAQIARKRFTQHGMGISCDGSTNAGRPRDAHFKASADSELDDCRPSSLGEEELQLRIALALSKEEAQKDELSRRDDDTRLQIALKQSQSNASSSGVGSAQTTSAVDDLLSLQQVFGSGASTSTATAPQHWRNFVLPPVPPPVSNDPWAPASSPLAASKVQTNDPFGTPLPLEAQNDPWMPLDVKQPSNDLISQGIKECGTLTNTVSMDTSVGGDPFAPIADSINDNKYAEPFLNGAVKGQNGLAKRDLRTPESFLGENSSLVNLDNLLGPPKQAADSNNQFSGGTSYNPFVAQQRPMPTLNEMRSTSSISNPMPTSDGPGGQSWTLQQPLQPQRPSSTNPFL